MLEIDYLHTSTESEALWKPGTFCVPTDTADPIDLVQWCPEKADPKIQFNPAAAEVGYPHTFYLIQSTAVACFLILSR